MYVLLLNLQKSKNKLLKWDSCVKFKESSKLVILNCSK